MRILILLICLFINGCAFSGVELENMILDNRRHKRMTTEEREYERKILSMMSNRERIDYVNGERDRERCLHPNFWTSPVLPYYQNKLCKKYENEENEIIKTKTYPPSKNYT